MDKIIYLDVETTGLDFKTCAIRQLAGIIEIDGIEVDRFNFSIRPDPDQAIYLAAMTATNYKISDLLKGQFSQLEAYNRFLYLLDSHINKYDKKDKFYMVGYNIHSFDATFIREFFERHGNTYFGAYFWHPSIDVMLLASYASVGQRDKLPNFKLTTVSAALGIETDEEKAHDAMYDVELTKSIYTQIHEELNTK